MCSLALLYGANVMFRSGIGALGGSGASELKLDALPPEARDVELYDTLIRMNVFT